MEYIFTNNSNKEIIDYSIEVNNGNDYYDLPALISFKEDKNEINIKYEHKYNGKLHKINDVCVKNISHTIGNYIIKTKDFYYVNGLEIEKYMLRQNDNLMTNLSINLFKISMENLKKDYHNIHIDYEIKDGKPYLNTLIVPFDIRRNGIGSEIIKKMISFSYAYNLDLSLSPLPVSKEKSFKRSKLIEFYSKFGFILKEDGDMYIDTSYQTFISYDYNYLKIKDLVHKINMFSKQNLVFNIKNFKNIFLEFDNNKENEFKI
jgi:hypothetical protein